MPFNAETYRLNRYIRERDQYLAAARDIKARAATGDAYEWELERLPRLIMLARGSNLMAVSQARVVAISKGRR